MLDILADNGWQPTRTFEPDHAQGTYDLHFSNGISLYDPSYVILKDSR